jgi:hypothetical protein
MKSKLAFLWLMRDLYCRVWWLRCYSKYLRYRCVVRVVTYYEPRARFLLWGAALWPILYFIFQLWMGGRP